MLKRVFYIQTHEIVPNQLSPMAINETMEVCDSSNLVFCLVICGNFRLAVNMKLWLRKITNIGRCTWKKPSFLPFLLVSFVFGLCVCVCDVCQFFLSPLKNHCESLESSCLQRSTLNLYQRRSNAINHIQPIERERRGEERREGEPTSHHLNHPLYITHVERVINHRYYTLFAPLSFRCLSFLASLASIDAGAELQSTQLDSTHTSDMLSFTHTHTHTRAHSSARRRWRRTEQAKKGRRRQRYEVAHR